MLLPAIGLSPEVFSTYDPVANWAQTVHLHHDILREIERVTNNDNDGEAGTNVTNILNLLMPLTESERYYVLSRLSWRSFIELGHHKHLKRYFNKKAVHLLIDRAEEVYWLDCHVHCHQNHHSSPLLQIQNSYSSTHNFHLHVLHKRLLRQMPSHLKSFANQFIFTVPYFIWGPTITDHLSRNDFATKNTTKPIYDLYLVRGENSLDVDFASSLQPFLTTFACICKNESNTLYVKVDDSTCIVIHLKEYQCELHLMLDAKLDVCWNMKTNAVYSTPAYHLLQKLSVRPHITLAVAQNQNQPSTNNSPGNSIKIQKVNYPAIPLNTFMPCYQCKSLFKPRLSDRLVPHYSSMCISCQLENIKVRHFEIPTLNGCVALVTGARIKIGYHTTLALLRNGCQVIGTTRFLANALYRYQRESDYAEFQHRLILYQLDLRHIPSLFEFVRWVKANVPRLDILVNNAAQTFTYDAEYWEQMLQFEQSQFEKLTLENSNSTNQPITSTSAASSFASHPLSLSEFVAPSTYNNNNHTYILCQNQTNSLNEWLFKTDQFGELITQGGKFWNQNAGEVTATEIMEATMVNQMAPEILITQLKALMSRIPDDDDNKDANISISRRSYIINLACQEGRFHMKDKPSTHFHTNCAKAALNMMTRTVAPEYRKCGIYINSVDPGWVSFALNTNKKCPIDCVDAAQRVLYPIYLSQQLSVREEPQIISGRLWKNNAPQEFW